MLFVDSSGWFAFFMPNDLDHDRVVDRLDQQAEPLLTTDYCIDETLTLLVARHEARRALDAGRAFFHRNLTNIHFVKRDQIHRAWLLFQQRAASGWSFTDCTSKIVIDDLGITAAVALDDHFRQFGNVAVSRSGQSIGSCGHTNSLIRIGWTYSSMIVNWQTEYVNAFHTSNYASSLPPAIQASSQAVFVAWRRFWPP